MAAGPRQCRKRGACAGVGMGGSWPEPVNIPWGRAVEAPHGSSAVPLSPPLYLIKAPCPGSRSAEEFSLAQLLVIHLVLLHDVWDFSSLGYHLLRRM